MGVLAKTLFRAKGVKFTEVMRFHRICSREIPAEKSQECLIQKVNATVPGNKYIVTVQKPYLKENGFFYKFPYHEYATAIRSH